MSTIRSDVAELLRAGYGTQTIARRLGVTNSSVKRAREALRIPAGLPGPKPYSSVEDTFWQRTKPVDGHLEWTGTVHEGRTPTLRHGGKRYTAYRVAFRICYRREPVGYVRPGCDHPGCVRPQHMEDRVMRDRYAAIFGEAS